MSCNKLLKDFEKDKKAANLYNIFTCPYFSCCSCMDNAVPIFVVHVFVAVVHIAIVHYFIVPVE